MALKYEEYLKMLKDNATQKYDATIDRAKGTLKEQQTAADAVFERSKPTYGMMAEQLAQSGLSGSGYSDNITRDAYAARQASYDNAHKIYGDTVRVAEQTKYADLLAAEREGLSYSEKIAEAFSTYYDGISAGESIDSIKNIVASNGFTKGQADALWSKAGWGSAMPTDVYDGLFGTMTEEGGETPATTPGSTPTVFPSPNTTNAIDAWRSNLGEITVDNFKPVYDALVSGDPAAKDAIMAFLREAPKLGGMTDTSQGSTVADYLYSKGVIGYETWKEAKAEAEADDELIDTAATGITVKRGLKLKEGDNFKAEVKNKDGSTSTYNVQIGSRQTDPMLLNRANEIADGTLFAYNGTIYVKQDGQVWDVEKRPWGGYGKYADFTEAAKSQLAPENITYSIDREPNDGMDMGDDFTFKDSLGNKFKVESAGETTNSAAKAAAAHHSVREPFTYDGEIYVKWDDGKVYGVRQRNMFRSGMYERLLASLDASKNEEAQSAGAAVETDNESSVASMEDAKVNLGYNFSFRAGENISVDVGDKKYKVQIGAAAEEDVQNVVKNKAQRGLFEYKGRLYYAHGGIAREVEARPVFNKGDYADLIAALGIKE